MQELLSNGHDFSLFQAVDLIDRIVEETVHTTGEDAATGSERKPAAEYVSPAREHIRFRGVRSLGFPAADIARIMLDWERVELEMQALAPLDQEPAPVRFTIETTCFGLYGPDSPLPDYVNERIAAYDHDETALRDFLDLFNHRLMMLLCRIGKRYRHFRTFDGEATDEISLLCGALIGEPDPFGRPPDDGRDHRLRNAAGLGLFSLSAEALEKIVADRFGIEVWVEEFVRRIIPVSREQRGGLGQQGHQLGETTLLGEAVESCDKIRLWLGPLSRDQWDDFLPDGPKWQILDVLLQKVLPAPLPYDIALIAADEATTPMGLGSGQLGKDFWLGVPQAQTREAKTMIFSVAA